MRHHILGWAFFVVWLNALPLASVQAEELVITGVDSPPRVFEKPEEGLRGFEVEVIEAAFARVGVAVTFKLQPWKRALKMTILGKFTAIMTCAHSKERAKVILFSEPLSQTTFGFYIRREFDGPMPKSPKETKGLRVGAILGWVHMKELKKVGADPQGFRTEKLALRDLLKGVFDYLYTSKESTGFQVKKLGLYEELEFVPTLRRDTYLCFSMKWENVEDLVIRFNAGLAQVRQDGTYDRIHSRYRLDWGRERCQRKVS